METPTTSTEKPKAKTETIYHEGKFLKKVERPDTLIINNEIFQEVKPPKSLKSQYEIIHNTKLDRKDKVMLSEDGSLVFIKPTQDQKNSRRFKR